MRRRGGLKRRRFGKRNGRKLNPKQKMEVKRLIGINTELKYFSSAIAPTDVTTVGILTGSGFDIPQGITDSTRIGDRIKWGRSIFFRYSVHMQNGVLADNLNLIRVMIFQFHPNIAPAINDILLPGPSGIPDAYSQYVHDTRQEYKILYDKVHKLTMNQAATNDPSAFYNDTSLLYHHGSISLKRASKQLQYTGGTVFGTNRLYLLLLSDSSIPTHPSFTGTLKTFYTDG